VEFKQYRFKFLSMNYEQLKYNRHVHCCQANIMVFGKINEIFIVLIDLNKKKFSCAQKERDESNFASLTTRHN
jgi:hypothetical protein